MIDNHDWFYTKYVEDRIARAKVDMNKRMESYLFEQMNNDLFKNFKDEYPVSVKQEVHYSIPAEYGWIKIPAYPNIHGTLVFDIIDFKDDIKNSSNKNSRQIKDSDVEFNLDVED